VVVPEDQRIPRLLKLRFLSTLIEKQGFFVFRFLCLHGCTKGTTTTEAFRELQGRLLPAGQASAQPHGAGLAPC